jgi:polar amino acid transport system substrate-binding protein
MKNQRLLSVLLIIMGLVTFKSSAQTKTVILTSLEWPPYIGEKLNEMGASAKIAKAAFNEMGYTLTLQFYPWSRTVQLAKEDTKIGGYFPEYYSDEVNNEFYLSDPIGTGPLGLAERKDGAIEWSIVEDLAKIEKIGTVRDYINTTDFDNLAAKGTIKVEPVTDDATNLLKISGNRIKCAVIDKYVMQYILNTDPRLKDASNLIQFNKKLLEDKKLYICFKRSEDGKKLRDIFNQGLKKVDVKAIMTDYMK